MWNSLKIACVVMPCVILALSTRLHAAPASDNASDAAYADGWQAGDNGGVGFMPWVLAFSGDPSALLQPGPQFIDTPPRLAGNTLGSPAFGLTTSSRQFFGDTSEANRTFSVPLEVGESFIIDVDGSSLNPAVDPFSAGNVLQLFGSDNVERFGIFTNNGFQADNWVAPGEMGNTGVTGGSAFRFEFTLESANTYDFLMRPVGGGAPYFSLNDAPLSGTVDVPIDRLRIATYGNGSSANGTLEIFFNNLRIITRPDNSWNVNSNGNWSSAANWTIGVPNSADAVAVFGAIITAPRTVTVDVPITVGRIGFENANAYRIAGTNTVTLNATSGDAVINVASGSHTISAPVALADNTVITVAPANGNLSITGALNSSGVSLTKAGPGNLTVNHVRATALSVNEGAVVIAPNGGNPGTSAVDNLSINGTSRFDLNNNDLVVRATAVTKDAVHGEIEADIISAQNGLDAALVTKWDGPGIASSTARTFNVAQGFDLTGVGVIRNSDLDETTGIPNSGYTSFSGQSVTPNDVLVKYTYIGDANLSGAVSFDDYVGMDNAFFGLIPNLGWATGDINFDNVINFDDYSKVDQAFFFQGPPLSGEAGVAAVPEPGTWVLAMLIGFAAMAFGRKSHPNAG